MSALPKHLFTLEEFLEFESRSTTRHEFYRGDIFDMTGGSSRHTLIGLNVLTLLSKQLRDEPCLAYSSDQKLFVKATGLVAYPDAMVACGEHAPTGGESHMLESPTVIAEVLSPSTADYDRGTKFEHYRQIESLSDYLLVNQDQMYVEHCRRKADNDWTSRVYKKPTDVVKLKSIGCELPLGEIYRRVTLDE